MKRPDLFGAAWWWAFALAALQWWTPAILLALAGLLLDRLRFRAALALGRALVALGLWGAAERVFAAEARRCDVQARRLRARRGC